MRVDVADESFGLDDYGNGIEVALPEDVIRKRHICTRASNRRQIIVLVVGDAEFEGYSIGLDKCSLQLLELPSGDVSTIRLEHIVAITDGKPFSKLTPDEKDDVDRRTASFRKNSQDWLVANWPKVYERRDEDGPRGHYQNRQRATTMRRPEPPAAGKPWTGPLLGEGSPDGGK